LPVTAAIAACLVAEGYSDDELRQLRSGCVEIRQKPRFLLLKGDISGMQDFIYTVTSKGAAKGLRGRSVYLQLLTEVIANWILRRLILPFVNLLYQGGITIRGCRMRCGLGTNPSWNERVERAQFAKLQ